MTSMEDIVSLCKRRGFVYPASEIYGGISGFWDYGPLGVTLVNNIKSLWWDTFVEKRDDVVGIDSSIIQNPKVWEASGHVTSFTDPLIECKTCHERFRADQPDEVSAHEEMHRKKKEDVSWTDPKNFNLLFRTSVGIIEGEKSVAYLRGETCQGIFVDFNAVVSSTRVKLPFGIAQIGKAFRNEVTPGKFIFRVREMEQMELEYFVDPGEAPNQLEYWKGESMKFVKSLGISDTHLRFRQHDDTERAHYAADSWDIEYEYPDWGFKELQGIANRTDYDLKAHSKWSGKNLSVPDPKTGKPIVPFVIEPSIGVGRLMLAVLADAFVKEENRIVLRLAPSIAPKKVAVFPLLANKTDLVSKAKTLYDDLKKVTNVAWDDRGNIGKRYLSQDEAGTPWCVTVDFTTLEDDTVTIRDRDTTKQERISIAKVSAYVKDHMKEENL